ncbi:hypothetical protein ENSA5_47820 [Enhygromyxa salina]|uniref:Uncharacterized protein n=1 Tax=Enhygromyxa salina TaxID=215803 RepID=A0A2S9XIU2_9BACT|nr:hypothetical protein [Enhygromyxa salina]PRP92601.1 hypothetical protein ENSA5_47820 [Enhygromyxa salina]
MRPGPNATLPVLLLALAASVGCTASKTREAAALDKRIAKLEQEETRRSTKLAELEGEIEVAERSLDRAVAEARRAECRAQKAIVEAKVTEAAAACGAQIAQHEACLARNDARVSKGAALGCGLGILSAVVSGGATAPLAIAGCAGGAVAGKATASSCGRAPACYERVRAERKQAVRDIHQLQACVDGATGSERPPTKRRSRSPRPAPGVPR